MAKGNNQKLKALHLLDILREQSDEEHPLTLNQLMSALEHRGVEIRDRKSLYSDIEALRLYGADIVGQHRGREYVYYLGEREFELPELKLLADAVQSSRFITQSKTMKLLGKLQRLTSASTAAKPPVSRSITMWMPSTAPSRRASRSLSSTVSGALPGVARRWKNFPAVAESAIG